jgi:hypothetical protein
MHVRLRSFAIAEQGSATVSSEQQAIGLESKIARVCRLTGFLVNLDPAAYVSIPHSWHLELKLPHTLPMLPLLPSPLLLPLPVQMC